LKEYTDVTTYRNKPKSAGYLPTNPPCFIKYIALLIFISGNKNMGYSQRVYASILSEKGRRNQTHDDSNLPSVVAKITTPHTILRALNYNEKKVQRGQAECLHAGNFLQDVKDMNFYDKLSSFKNLIELNSRAKTTTLHISLNFDRSEKYEKEKLMNIASIYTDKIGFGGQP
jgi:hypothetical protein